MSVAALALPGPPAFPVRPRLVLASHNAGKLRELQALLGAQSLELLGPEGLGLKEPDEPFHTFLENALHKARQASAGSGLPALADDSGLSVQALGGAPGVHSAHCAGLVHELPGEDREARRRRQDAANNRALLQALQSAPAGVDGQPAPRRAAFVCTPVAVRRPDDPEPLEAQGRWEGRLLEAPQGQGGFGYDPLMWIDEAGATVAELGHEAKNSLSHRARAAALLRPMLQQVWGWELGAPA